MRNSLLDGDMPADKTYANSSYNSANGGVSGSSSGLASYFSADETKTVSRRTFSLLAITIAVLSIIFVSLALALHFKSSTIEEVVPPPTTPVTPVDPTSLPANIQSADLMTHINALGAIATANNGTRVISQSGFNASIDYIYAQLQGTAFKLQKQYFPVERWYVNVAQTSLTTYDSDGVNATWIYGTDYQAITNSGVQGNNAENSTVVSIANGGCNQADWQDPAKSVAGLIAIVVRDDSQCNFARKAQYAQNANAIGLLIYNTENNPDLATNVAVTQYTRIPVMLTTFAVGFGIVQAANAGSGFYVDMVLNLANNGTVIVTNIIADTESGDITSTVVVGSHSDGVQRGPGVNDNGSGSSANLAMALRVDALLKSGEWKALPNRIRFMWFGAEEAGLLGSRYHVQQAQASTTPGERTADYAVMLNYDMLGSPNFYFGVYNATTAPVNTPTKALAGSRLISQLHYDYFVANALPYDGCPFDGRSDYGQFLAVGIVAGGLFSGAEQSKTSEQRRRYDAMLGPGMGGIASAAYDPCYHQACDDVDNIHQGAHINMTRAAAYVVQTLAQTTNLRSFLQYPQ